MSKSRIRISPVVFPRVFVAIHIPVFIVSGKTAKHFLSKVLKYIKIKSGSLGWIPRKGKKRPERGWLLECGLEPSWRRLNAITPL